VLIDVLSEEHLAKAGALLARQAAKGPVFTVGSSGVEYALTRHWGFGEASASAAFAGAGEVERLLAVSGSCSPVTEQQIRWALDRGFRGVAMSAERLVEAPEATEAAALEAAGVLLRQGHNVIVYTALGSDDPSIGRTKALLAARETESRDTGRLIGRSMGRLARRLQREFGLNRLAVAGGDTSGYVAQELGIYALEMIAPLAPGGPLCRCSSEHADVDGLEIALKGGQVGKADFFECLRLGRAMQ